MPSRIALLFALAASLGSPAVLGAGFSLAGHALGVRLDDVVSDPRYECDSASACFLYSTCALKATAAESVAGVPLELVVLYFSGERLTAVEVQFAPGQFQAVATTLSREYGVPSIEAAVGQAASPDATNSDVLTWRQGRRVLRLQQRTPESGRASAILSEENFLSELLAR